MISMDDRTQHQVLPDNSSTTSETSSQQHIEQDTQFGTEPRSQVEEEGIRLVEAEVSQNGWRIMCHCHSSKQW